MKKTITTLLLGSAILLGSASSTWAMNIINEVEPNNNMSTATPYSGSFTSEDVILGDFKDSNDVVDYYVFTAPKTGNLLIDLNSIRKDNDFNLYLLNSSGKTIASSTDRGARSQTVEFKVTEGATYYIKVSAYKKGDPDSTTYGMGILYLKY